MEVSVEKNKKKLPFLSLWARKMTKIFCGFDFLWIERVVLLVLVVVLVLCFFVLTFFFFLGGGGLSVQLKREKEKERERRNHGRLDG